MEEPLTVEEITNLMNSLSPERLATSRESMAMLRELLAKCESGPARFQCAPLQSHEEAVAFFAKAIEAYESSNLWGVVIGERLTAITGNGPQAEAHARLYAMFHTLAPMFISWIEVLEEIGALLYPALRELVVEEGRNE